MSKKKKKMVMRRMLEDIDDYEWEDDEDYPYIK